MPFKNWEMMEM